LRVTFLCPPFNVTGGQRVIAIHARALKERGHDVLVVAWPRRFGAREHLRALLGRREWPRQIRVEDTHVGRSGVPWRVLDRARAITQTDVPDADVLVATWWETAEWAAEMPIRKGAPVYLIQDHEIFARLRDRMRTSAVERVRTTYRLPMQKVVVSRWLGELARDQYGDPSALVVPNAVDHAQFWADPREKAKAPTVGVLYSRSPRKNIGLALEAFQVAKGRVPELRLTAFGSGAPLPEFPLPTGTDYQQRPPQERIRDIYTSCDAWLFSSQSEGFGLPILEAMACRTPVIATRAGAAPEILEGGGGVLLAALDPDEMANAIVGLVTAPAERWSRLSQEAAVRASEFTWETSTRLFEFALTRAVERANRGEIGPKGGTASADA
jgi:glycosyltransferase involved in cell wall biosynthesis